MDSVWHDIKKRHIIRSLKSKLKDRPLIEEKVGYLLLNRQCVLAKKKQKFRLVGHIDWVKES